MKAPTTDILLFSEKVEQFFEFTKIEFSNQNTFAECPNLTGILSGLFNNNPVTNFEGTFSDSTGISSAVHQLWISHPAATHVGCFLNVTNASNYGSIPVDWK